jgi:hypothetical protein
LKPYIYYSARYKDGDNDITVNYSLDNYVTIYGYLGNEYISNSGYLIDTSKLKVDAEGNVTWYKINDVEKFSIDKETLKEYDENGNEVTTTEDTSAKSYYQEAYDFTKWLLSSGIVNTVTPKNAVKSDGSTYDEFQNDNTKILDISSSNDPENKESAFVQHKKEIIKLSIQDNLNNAIAVYDANSSSMGVNAKFQMPILTEEDWDKILTNVNMISFMQGLQAGTKTYSDYSIVTSTQNKQYVNPNSIYFIKDGDNYYHRINCPNLTGSNIVGYKSIDFRRLKNTDETAYYYKHKELACYNCIVNPLNEKLDVSSLSLELQKSYYMALARERYNLEKVTKMLIYTK